jgi:hypothetical protein
MIRHSLRHQSPHSSPLHPRLPSNLSPLDLVVPSHRFHPVPLVVPVALVVLVGQWILANPLHLVGLVILPVLVSPAVRYRLCHPSGLVDQSDLAPQQDLADQLDLLVLVPLRSLVVPALRYRLCHPSGLLVQLHLAALQVPEDLAHRLSLSTECSVAARDSSASSPCCRR